MAARPDGKHVCKCVADKLAQALRDQGIGAVSVAELGLGARSDAHVFSAAGVWGYALLTEHVGGFARLCGEQVAAADITAAR